MTAVLRVALPVPLPGLFDYLPPGQGDARVGDRVWVPFGRGRQVGVVIEVIAAQQSTVAVSKLKHAIALLDDAPLLDAELMSSLAWATDYWLGMPGEVYAQALPPALRQPQALPDFRDEIWAITAAGRSALDAGSRRGKSLSLLRYLHERPASAKELHEHMPDWREPARRLSTAGLIERIEQTQVASTTSQAGPTLSAEQETAVMAIGEAWGRFQPFLLDGVTGSGKTEVYLALIEQALERGEQTLLLVPEIGLAPQALRRLRQRLGVPVEVLHSNLAGSERAKSWLRARSAQAQVILGTRSAIFTPLPKAGLIIVDEEHDAAYKQQDGFRYHARDLALVRARALHVPVVLGSATPSLESLANVEAGRYQALHLRSRPASGQPTRVQIVDMRAQRLEHGLSPVLLQALADALHRGEQALVFRNRRGYAPVLLCHACGWHAECPRCEHPLTMHAARRRLICHHCDYQTQLPPNCPQCGGTELKPQGQGTERLEEALTRQFPGTPVLRIDRETMRRRDAFSELLDRLRADEPAILVGTQMLAKGHDLPNLTLVAIVNVDEGLHSVDFRAAERLTQIIVQVAGRAGRAHKPGHVLLQTHYPDHPVLRQLLAHGYAAAAQTLLAERKEAQLPPYTHHVLLRAEAHRHEAVDAFMREARSFLPAHDDILIAGPMAAPMPLRAGRHRAQLLLESSHRALLHQHVEAWHAKLLDLRFARTVRWSIDVDPIDLY